MTNIVKCPICNAKVPFSLQMHLHMHTVYGPGGRPEDDPATSPGDELGSKPVEKRKGPRPGKRRQGKKGQGPRRHGR